MLRNTYNALQNHVVQSSDMHYLNLLGWKIEDMKKKAENLEKAEEMNASIQSLNEGNMGIFQKDLRLIKTARVLNVTYGTQRLLFTNRETLKSCSIEIGYSKDEIMKQIPNYFEGHLPVLIAEFGTSLIKINITEEDITFEGTGNDSTFCVVLEEEVAMRKIWDCFPFIRMFENFKRAMGLIIPSHRWRFPEFPILPDMSSEQKVAIHENSCGYWKDSLLAKITDVESAPKKWSRECCVYVQKTLDGEEELPKNRCRSVLNYWKNEFKKERKMVKKLISANCRADSYYLENGRVDMEKAEKALARAAKRRKIS